MHACTERPTPTQIAATLSKISKKHVDTSHLSTEHFYSEAHQVSRSQLGALPVIHGGVRLLPNRIGKNTYG